MLLLGRALRGPVDLALQRDRTNSTCTCVSCVLIFLVSKPYTQPALI